MLTKSPHKSLKSYQGFSSRAAHDNILLKVRKTIIDSLMQYLKDYKRKEPAKELHTLAQELIVHAGLAEELIKDDLTLSLIKNFTEKYKSEIGAGSFLFKNSMLKPIEQLLSLITSNELTKFADILQTIVDEYAGDKIAEYANRVLTELDKLAADMMVDTEVEATKHELLKQRLMLVQERYQAELRREEGSKGEPVVTVKPSRFMDLRILEKVEPKDGIVHPTAVECVFLKTIRDSGSRLPIDGEPRQIARRINRKIFYCADINPPDQRYVLTY